MKKNIILSNRRLAIYFLIIFIGFIFISKLFYVQIIKKSYYNSLAKNNAIRRVTQPPERGLIYDRNNNLLAKNDSIIDIMIIPKELNIKNRADTLEICKYFNITKIELKEKIQNAKNYSYRKGSLFLNEVSESLIENLFQFQGFYIQPRMVRKYNTNYAANILGYLGEVNHNNIKKDSYYEIGDRIGISGVDKSYEKILRGEKGVKYIIQNVQGKQLSYEEGAHDTLSKPGKSINLTIDLNLQEFGETIMKNYKGSIVAIEPSTGEILCLITSPSYNPSDLIGKKRNLKYPILNQNNKKPLFDRSLLLEFSPGSTIKMLTALIGLEEGVITTGTKIDCNFGWNYGKRLNIACHGTDHPPMNITNALSESCNAYFCELFCKIIDKNKSSAIGLNTWSKYIHEFGFGDFLNNDLYTGRDGNVPNGDFYNKIYGEKRWGAPSCVSLGIGQGELLVTPIQLANYTAILANRGYFIIPHIIKKIQSPLSLNKYFAFQSIKKTFSEKKYVSIAENYFEYIITGMERVVEGFKGTARNSKITNLKICGKTGTVENYANGIKQKDHSVFIAFSPKKNPKIAIAVFIENGGDGGDVAAPIASLCIEKYLNNNIDLSFQNKPYFNPLFKNYIKKTLN